MHKLALVALLTTCAPVTTQHPSVTAIDNLVAQAMAITYARCQNCAGVTIEHEQEPSSRIAWVRLKGWWNHELHYDPWQLDFVARNYGPDTVTIFMLHEGAHIRQFEERLATGNIDYWFIDGLAREALADYEAGCLAGKLGLATGGYVSYMQDNASDGGGSHPPTAERIKIVLGAWSECRESHE